MVVTISFKISKFEIFRKVYSTRLIFRNVQESAEFGQYLVSLYGSSNSQFKNQDIICSVDVD